MADQERELQLDRHGDVALRFSVRTWGDAWGSVHVGRRQRHLVVFARASKCDVRMTARDEDSAAAVWIGNAAFDLLDHEVERVRALFGLPRTGETPATRAEGAARHG